MHQEPRVAANSFCWPAAATLTVAYLFPAYPGGRTLAESYWAAIPAVSWMNFVVGDPLCKLAR